MSSPHRIVVLDGMPANPGDVGWGALEALGQVTVYEATPPELVRERIAGATAIVTNKVRIDADALAAAPGCRIVCSLATGYDHIDVAGAAAKGIRVANVPAYSTASTAQLSIALLLALAHRAEAHHEAVQRGDWSKASYFSYWTTPQVELEGRRMLVVGSGAIGARVATIAEALGMETAFAAIPGRPARPERMSWTDGLEWADVVSLHVPLTPTSRHLIDADALAAMRPGTWLVNGARGAVVDEAAVAASLRDGHLGAYATDVLSVEPPPADHVLIGAPNCLITPHLGWVTLAARKRLIETTARNIAALDAGERLNVVGG